MNKTAIKNFAIWARNKLIADITYKAGLVGITKDSIKAPLPQSTKDMAFFDIGMTKPSEVSGKALEQRRRLVKHIEDKATASGYKAAYSAVVEETAYTWFNRLIAVRFMEVNDYLPSHIRVLSSGSETKLEPDLVTTPFDAGFAFTGADKADILTLKEKSDVDGLFRMLFIKQCNALNAILPKLFEKTEDYTELLLNVSVTDKDGVVYRLVHDIPEEDFNIRNIGEDGKPTGQVEIIGWLYQYYNTEPKADTFALLKKNVKITKERIPAATQLFTPDWIVRYMVENSLGRLWIECKLQQPAGFTFPISFPTTFDDRFDQINDLKHKWKYYLEEAKQEPEVQEQLAEIRKSYKGMGPKTIKFIDPCMGSGHILVYAFEVLMQIYTANGWDARDAAKSILENNIYGLDIDDRAFQLAYFAVMMKARQYNRRILDGETGCHVYSIQESNGIDRNQLKYFGAGLSDIEKNDALNQLNGLLDTLADAKEYGSILNVEPCDWELLRRFVCTSENEGQIELGSLGLEETKERLKLLIDIGQVMAQKYDVVVTNPPYMGLSNGDGKLNTYVKNNYPDSKADLFAVFIERCGQMTAENRYQAMITQHSWMFLSSFEKLRKKLLLTDTVNMAHLGARAFDEIGGEVVQTTSFVFRTSNVPDYKGVYARLIEPNTQKGKEDLFLACESRYTIAQDNFSRIPGAPIAYWASEKILSAYLNGELLSEEAYVKIGMGTGKNEIFVREWWEVQDCLIDSSLTDISGLNKSNGRYFPYNKGGEFRLWYGNLQEVLWFDYEGQKLMNTMSGHRENGAYDWYCKQGLTWSFVSSSKFGIRFLPYGCFFDVAGSTLFSQKDNFYTLGFLASNVCFAILGILNPTLNYQAGNIKSLPIIYENVETVDIIVKQNIGISKHDWDSLETSWDFDHHPLCGGIDIMAGIRDSTGKAHCLISSTFAAWKSMCNASFTQLKSNEEELNRIFIEIYGLQDELTPDVAEKDVTVHYISDTKEAAPEGLRNSNYLLTKKDVVISLISYAVGCMFGRYSLDTPGLAYAGGEWDVGKYTSFIPDQDNILPITDEEYFTDDITGLFCAWLKKAYGADTLEENLDFIADALGGRGQTSHDVIRNYFINDFYQDHCKTYKKRPIYWLFDSGKQNGFKALIYMHRYNENTIGNLRVDYLHRMERVYENELIRMQDVITNSADARDVAAATKRKEKLQKQLKECKDYDEKIAHLALARIAIDLDDGVKVNYEKVQTGADGKKYEVLGKV